MFIRRDGLKVFVARRHEAGDEDEQPPQECPTTPLGRAEMVRRIVEEHLPVAEVAAGFGVSERTANKSVARWRAEDPAGLENRSSRWNVGGKGGEIRHHQREVCARRVPARLWARTQDARSNRERRPVAV
ncbi:MAG: leucine zipper domain-containing protein, partial [Kiloniellales bacterium]|nr:leucine zipper domain-containing protein [Kiloniellales bacterium]